MAVVYNRGTTKKVKARIKAIELLRQRLALAALEEEVKADKPARKRPAKKAVKKKVVK